MADTRCASCDGSLRQSQEWIALLFEKVGPVGATDRFFFCNLACLLRWPRVQEAQAEMDGVTKIWVHAEPVSSRVVLQPPFPRPEVPSPHRAGVYY